MPDIRCIAFGSFVAVLALVGPLVVVGQQMPANRPWIPLVGVEFSDTGDLIGWQAELRPTVPVQLISPGSRLLTVQVYTGEGVVTDRLRWHRLDNIPGYLGRFAGTWENIEIHRSYKTGASTASLIHELIVISKPDDLRIKLVVPPALVRHSDGDNSLGDIFYSYIRLYSASSTDDSHFKVVRENAEGERVAMAVRHFGVLFAPDNNDNSVQMTIKTGNMIEIDLGQIDVTVPHVLMLSAAEMQGAEIAGSDLEGLLYTDLARPLRSLAHLIEWCLQLLSNALGNVGFAIIVFAIVVRLMFMPIGLWSIRQQHKFTDVQSRMKPVISRIEEQYDGAEKSERILQTYKDFGVSPFSGLKGSTSLFLQIPILIALFSVTTESAMFREASFLWVTDLSLPDHFAPLPFAIPGLGAFLNLLPLVLGVISAGAAVLLSRSIGAGEGGMPKSGLILALVFVVFFYSCASALVVYWIVVNVSQVLESFAAARVGIRDKAAEMVQRCDAASKRR